MSYTLIVVVVGVAWLLVVALAFAMCVAASRADARRDAHLPWGEADDLEAAGSRRFGRRRAIAGSRSDPAA